MPGSPALRRGVGDLGVVGSPCEVGSRSWRPGRVDRAQPRWDAAASAVPPARRCSAGRRPRRDLRGRRARSSERSLRSPTRQPRIAPSASSSRSCRLPRPMRPPAWGDPATGAVVPRRRPPRRRRRATGAAGARHDHGRPARRRSSRSARDSRSRARVTPLPGAEQSGFRLRPVGEVRDRGGAARVAGLGGGPAHGSRGCRRRDSAATGAPSCPASPSATRAASARSSTPRCSASSLSHLTAVSGANCAIVTAAAFALAALCRLASGRTRRRGARRPARLRRARDAPAERRACRGDGRRRARRHRRRDARAAASRRSPSPSSDCSRSTRGSPATTGSPCPPRRRQGSCCWPVHSPHGSPGDADAARGRARGAARGAARLPAHPHPARPGDRALRRARQPAGRAGGARRHRRRAPRLPRPARPAVGRHGASSRSRGCRRRGSRSSRMARPALPGGRLPWLPDAAGALLLAGCTALALGLAIDGPTTSPGARDRARPCSRWASPCRSASGSARRSSIGATRPGAWDVAACDVGQGDAVLVRSAGRDGAHRHRAASRPRSSAASRCSGSTGSTCSS